MNTAFETALGATAAKGATSAPVTGSAAELDLWTERLVAWHAEHPCDDPAHDLDHVLRVWSSARAIALAEGGADLLVVLAACLLHDMVNVPKNDPRRFQASRLAAREAVVLLASMGFPADRLDAVAHAIEAHSFSANIEPLTLEAKIVQDADRIDSLGAIGVARCMAVSGLLRRGLVNSQDPLAEERPLNDLAYALDHFAVKLLRLPDTMRTETGCRIARQRAAFLDEYRTRLVDEIRGLS